MTEYDYSPDAIERFQAKMAGVGKWASDQSYWRSGYGNPFIDGSPSPSTTARPSPPSRQESSSTRPRERPQPSRSRTLPTNLNPPAPSGYGQTSRALAYAQTPAPRPHTSSTSRNHHHHHYRSGSQPPDVRNPYPYPAPPQAHPVVPAQGGSHMVYAPPGARVMYKQYDYVPGKTTVLPVARPGEHFVVVAPAGAHVDRMRPSSHSHSHSRSSGSGGGSKAGSPTKKSGDPLFKRILTGLRPNIDWGDRDSSRSRSSSRLSKRRSASR